VGVPAREQSKLGVAAEAGAVRRRKAMKEWRISVSSEKGLEYAHSVAGYGGG
jgi:hypothetical protein